MLRAESLGWMGDEPDAEIAEMAEVGRAGVGCGIAACRYRTDESMEGRNNMRKARQKSRCHRSGRWVMDVKQCDWSRSRCQLSQCTSSG